MCIYFRISWNRIWYQNSVQTLIWTTITLLQTTFWKWTSSTKSSTLRTSPKYPRILYVCQFDYFSFFVFNPWDLYYQGYKKNNNNDDNDDDDVPAAAVHLRLGRCAWFVVRLRHHDLHRVHRVLHRPHRTHRQQTVSMLLATSRLNLAVLQCCCVSITVS